MRWRVTARLAMTYRCHEAMSVRLYSVSGRTWRGACLLRCRADQLSPQQPTMMLSRGAKAAARASTQFARCQPRRFDSHSTGHGESAGHEESALRIAGGSGSESMGVREDDSTHHTAYVNSVIERLLCG